MTVELLVAKKCCCGEVEPPGDVFESCSSLYADGILPSTITAQIEFDVSFGRPIPFSFNREELFYTGSYSATMQHTFCSEGGCAWDNIVGWSELEGTATVRRIVYDFDGNVISDDTATAIVPDDFEGLPPFNVAFCVTGTFPDVPTYWEHIHDPNFSRALEGSGGNNVFAMLIGCGFLRDMPQSFFPNDVEQLEPEAILLRGTASIYSGQELLDAQAEDPIGRPVFSLSASVSFS